MLSYEIFVETFVQFLSCTWPDEYNDIIIGTYNIKKNKFIFNVKTLNDQ